MKKLGLKGLLGITVFCTWLTGCGVTETQSEVGEVSENEIGKIYLAGDEVELSIRAQDDFYGYVNAEYLWNMETAYDASTNGTFDQVSKAVDEDIKDIIREIVSSDEEYERGSNEQFIRDYYNLMKSGNYTDKKVFDDVFKMIDNADNLDQLTNVYGELSYKYGVNSFIPISIDVDSYNPSRYTLNMEACKPVNGDLEKMYDSDGAVNDFRESMSDRMTGYGIPKDDAEDMADRMAYIWIDIACNTDFDSPKKMDVEKMLNKYTLDELSELITNVNVREYFRANGFNPEKIDYVYVNDPAQLQVLNTAYTEENLTLWKEYAKCAFISEYSIYTPDEYTNDDPYFEDIDEDKILDEVANFCGGQLSYIYYDRYYTDEVDEYMHRMEDDIKASYVDMISDADWLSDEGRKAMIEKFNNIKFHYGGEVSGDLDLARGNSIAGNVLQTKINGAKLNNDDIIKNLYEEPDHNIWGMASQTVNAYYNPEFNSIYITRGIMNGAFFDMDRDYYSNLGALGVVICHELSHAFDSNGVKYDMDGKYNPSWISGEDQAAFQEIVDAVDAHYDEYALLEVYYVDGEQTVAENLADIGGMECILNIADSKEEYEAIFTGYARVWCTLYQNKDLIYYLENDAHSPDIVRVNAVLSCFQEFYDTYDVKEGDGMYIAQEDRVIRW